jgi:hypothetical protein
MSTAPEQVEFEALFEQLFSASNAILQCEEAEVAQLQRLMDEREPLIQALHTVVVSALSPEQKDCFEAWRAKIQAIDSQIEAHFKRILTAQSEDLKMMARSRQALAGYQFPYTTDVPGVENQG